MKKLFWFMVLSFSVFGMEPLLLNKTSSIVPNNIKFLLSINPDNSPLESDLFRNIRPHIAYYLNQDSSIIRNILEDYPLKTIELNAPTWKKNYPSPEHRRFQNTHYTIGYLSKKGDTVLGSQYLSHPNNSMVSEFSYNWQARALSSEFNKYPIRFDVEDAERFFIIYGQEGAKKYPTDVVVSQIVCKPDDTAFAYLTEDKIIVALITKELAIKDSKQEFAIDTTPIRKIKDIIFNWHPTKNELFIVINYKNLGSKMVVWDITIDKKQEYDLAELWGYSHITRLCLSPDGTKIALANHGYLYIYGRVTMNKLRDLAVGGIIIPRLKIISWNPESTMCLLCLDKSSAALLWHAPTNSIVKKISAFKNQYFLDIKWLKNNKIVFLEDDYSTYTVDMIPFLTIYKFLTTKISLELSLLLVAIENSNQENTNKKFIVDELFLERYKSFIRVGQKENDENLEIIMRKYVQLKKQKISERILNFINRQSISFNYYI